MKEIEKQDKKRAAAEAKAQKKRDKKKAAEMKAIKKQNKKMEAAAMKAAKNKNKDKNKTIAAAAPQGGAAIRDVAPEQPIVRATEESAPHKILTTATTAATRKASAPLTVYEKSELKVYGKNGYDLYSEDETLPSKVYVQRPDISTGWSKLYMPQPSVTLTASQLAAGKAAAEERRPTVAVTNDLMTND